MKHQIILREELLTTPDHQREHTAPANPAFNPIFTYTRAQAVLDGIQIQVSQTAREAGIRCPVFITRAVYDRCVAVHPGVTGQDEAGRLWDILWMLRYAILRTKPGQVYIPVALYVRNDNHSAKLIKLLASTGPLDIDDPSPTITLELPGED